MMYAVIMTVIQLSITDGMIVDTHRIGDTYISRTECERSAADLRILEEARSNRDPNDPREVAIQYECVPVEK